jgi:hypothetical protein
MVPQPLNPGTQQKVSFLVRLAAPPILISGPSESPILGRKPTSRPVRVFDEDGDILAHNINIQNIPIPMDVESEQGIFLDFGVLIIVENPYKRRMRRRMVQDPVTGKANAVNPQKPKKTKISRPESGIDLRLLDNFDSKLIAKKRLSVCPLTLLS